MPLQHFILEKKKKNKELNYLTKEEITEVEKEKFEIENKTFEGFLKEKEQDFLNLEEKTSDFFEKLEDKIKD